MHDVARSAFFVSRTMPRSNAQLRKLLECPRTPQEQAIADAHIARETAKLRERYRRLGNAASRSGSGVQASARELHMISPCCTRVELGAI